MKIRYHEYLKNKAFLLSRKSNHSNLKLQFLTVTYSINDIFMLFYCNKKINYYEPVEMVAIAWRIGHAS